MSALGLVYRSSLRARWRSWLALAGLVALTGAACLAALAAGRRTSQAVPRLLASTDSPDATMISGQIAGGQTPLAYATVASLPGVVSDVRGTGFYYARLLVGGSEQDQTSGGAGVVEFPIGRGSIQPKLLAGRLPDPANPTEVLADYALEQSFPHVRVGSPVVVTLLSAAQPGGVLTNEAPPVLGSTVTMTVVGLVVDGTSLPSGTQENGGTIQVTPAFVADYGSQSFGGAVDILRLRGGGAGLPRFEAALQAVPGVTPGLGNVGVVGADAGYGVVEASIHPQVVGWWLLAALTGLAAATVIAQALSRQAALEADSYPVLRAIGCSPRELFLLGMARALVIGIVGAIGAAGLAYALSPLTPVGLARVAEPSPGLHFDAPVLLGGLLAVSFAVALAGLWPARSAMGRWSRQSQPEDTASSRLAVPSAWLARAGAAPTAVLGTRLALERRPGRESIPTASSLVGAAAAVTALVGTVVFGASLAHLMATPRLYGNDFQLGSNGPFAGFNVDGVQTTIQGAVGPLPGVIGVTVGDAVGGNAGPTPVSVLGLETLRGPLALAMVSGRAPRGADEVVLGAATLHALHTRLGADVRLTIATATATYRVVGTAALPLNFDGAYGGMGNGAVVTMASLATSVCGCPVAAALDNGGSEDLYVSFANRASLAQAESAAAQAVSRPTNLALADFALTPDTTAAPAVFLSFGQTVNFPLLLSLVVAIFAAASLVHLLAVSVHRRRREVGVLKAIGFVRHQVAAEVGWQSAAVMAVGIVVGAPLGLAAGRLAWNLFASSYGVVDVVVLPAWQLAAILGLCLVGAEAIAAVPALLAARVRPAVALRRT